MGALFKVASQIVINISGCVLCSAGHSVSMMNGSVFRRIIDVFSLTDSVLYFTGHLTGKVAYLMRGFCVQHFMRGCRVHALKCLLLDPRLIIDVIGIGVVDNNGIVVALQPLL